MYRVLVNTASSGGVTPCRRAFLSSSHAQAGTAQALPPRLVLADGVPLPVVAVPLQVAEGHDAQVHPAQHPRERAGAQLVLAHAQLPLALLEEQHLPSLGKRSSNKNGLAIEVGPS